MNEYAKLTLILIVVGFLILAALLYTGILIPIDMTVTSVIDRAVEERMLQVNWSTAKPVEGERGNCLFYETLSTETEFVDTLEPLIAVNDLPEEFRCNDGFTLALSKNVHICNGERCPGINGLMYSDGEVEEFYATCGGVSSCPNARSGVIFGFDLDEDNHLVDDSVCLQYTENEGEEPKWSTTHCFPKDYFDTMIFSAIDQIDVGVGFRTRIRIPNTDVCMVPDIANDTVRNAQCSLLATNGFEWLLLNDICTPSFSTANPGGPRVCTIIGERCFNSYLTTIPTDYKWPPLPELTDGDPTSCESLKEINNAYNELLFPTGIRSYKSLLSNEDGSLSLVPLDSCRTLTGETNPAQQCRLGTTILSSLSWGSL